MILKSFAVKSALKKKGFEEYNLDHKYYIFMYNGKKTTLRTKLSHNHQDLNDYLISQMSKQLSLNKNEFCKLILCALSETEYIEILQAKGLL